MFEFTCLNLLNASFKLFTATQSKLRPNSRRLCSTQKAFFFLLSEDYFYVGKLIYQTQKFVTNILLSDRISR